MSGSPDAEVEKLKEIVQLHARQIGEYVDTVQIFVTKHLDGGEYTRSYDFGTGNYHARYGQAREWVVMQDEYSREWARTKQRKDMEGGDE